MKILNTILDEVNPQFITRPNCKCRGCGCLNYTALSTDAVCCTNCGIVYYIGPEVFEPAASRIKVKRED